MKTTTRALLASLPLFLAAAAAAQDPCPNPQRLRNMCMFVGNLSADTTNSGKWRYNYERRFHEAACVDTARDSKEVVARKISQLWRQEEERLVCNNLQFDVQDGNILKYAVAVQFDAFIADAIAWKVNLNKVDASDGRTLLDYVQYHMERTRGGAVEKKLANYYDALRKAGARHKRELP